VPVVVSVDAVQPAITVRDLSKSFGDVQALDHVSLEVASGTVLGLLGPNGAGKTTIVRVLTTLLKADSGEARVVGLDVVRDQVELRSKIGLAGQYAAVDENLTGLENLTMVGRLYGMPRAAAKARGKSCCSALTWSRRPGGRSRPTRAGCGGGWTSARRSWPSRPCCSWTSRRPALIRAAG
jgi:ABC-2 type transport system ATP-binding protein